MNNTIRTLFVFFALILIAIPTRGDEPSAEDPKPLLIQNARIYDGKSDDLITGMEVLVEGNKIAEIAACIEAPSESRVMDADGRVLMPGMIDTHVHLSVPINPADIAIKRNWLYIGAAVTKGAEDMLMRGFTTVRDAGGAVIGLNNAIDEGFIHGPRIFPSGPFIGQTAGHGDLRLPQEAHPHIHSDVPASFIMRHYSILADGHDEVLRATREVFHMGATQAKIHAGGGGATPDPLHTTQYTVTEMKAAVQAAEDYGSYVLAHLYSDASIQRALEAGVKSLEHGTLMTEESAKLIKDQGVYLVPQFRLFEIQGDADREYMESLGPSVLESALKLEEGMKNQVELIKKHQLTIGFGTDQFGSSDAMKRQSEEFATRAKYFTNREILDQLYRINVEILEMSGLLNPYSEGKLGVIEPGAYADILIVDGNPLEDITVLGDYEEKILVIMKDGKIFKNTIE